MSLYSAIWLIVRVGNELTQHELRGRAAVAFVILPCYVLFRRRRIL